MNQTTLLLTSGVLLAISGSGAADPALTIYNQDFGVVRDTINLNLKQGINQVGVTDLASHLEPDSVILRDPTEKRKIAILEQNYRSDPVSQELLLSLNEGKTIDFLVAHGDRTETVAGKIVRSGYVPHQLGISRYGQQRDYYDRSGQPIIEVDGKLRFGLPGTPIFPNLPDDTILKPTLHWVLEVGEAGPLTAELAYVTGGMTWKADYNVVAPETGDLLDLTGWVTMDNQSGKTFENARIKLMAGDVNKVVQLPDHLEAFKTIGGIGGQVTPPQVTEKTFDEYHLYTLTRPATLHDRETKQVQFVTAGHVQSQRVYIYDGVKIDERYNGYSQDYFRTQRGYGTESNPKVWVMREIKNTLANGLGMPLPKGRVRFYRRDSGTAGNAGALEFIGENMIDHTPRDETLRIFTGNAFDIVGERKQTAYKLDPQRNQWLDESFEIKLRNHKHEAAEVRVVEHLYRGANWEITQQSNPLLKTDSNTIEFRVTVPPDQEKVLTYMVHYSYLVINGW